MSISFIAEVSSNHSKYLARALDFIDSAAEIGCDSVKFQLFKVDQLFSPEVLERSEKLKNRKQFYKVGGLKWSVSRLEKR